MRFPKFYARLAQGAIETFYEPVAREITVRLRKRSGINYFTNASILDVGCGSGELAIGLALLNWSSVVMALDKSRDLLNIAANNFKSFGLREININFIEGDARELPFVANSFDFVVSSGVLHCVENPSLFLSECARVLRPGGDLWIYDPSVLITDKEMLNPVFLKKRLSDLRDRFLLRLASVLSSSRVPPAMMNMDEALFIIDEAEIRKNCRFLKIQARKEGYLKIEIVKE